MSPLKCLLILILYFITTIYAQQTDTYFLQQGESIEYKPISSYPKLRIYCNKGQPKYLIHIWQSVVLQINSTKEYTLYEGSSPELVKKDHNDEKYSWSLNFLSWKQPQLKLDPFTQSCVGIVSKDPYTVTLNVIRIDYWKVLILVLGILTFLSADKLSKNSVFYYTSGVTLGICASFLILIYLTSRLFPRKPVMYTIAAVGWTIGIYILQVLWENFRTILTDYKIYLIWYGVVTGIISFIICYRWGPIENERSKNLMRWGLKAMGLAAIFFSTHFQEAAMAQIVILLLIHNFPSSWLAKPKKYWKRKFPPKVKLLSNDQYYEQGVRETTKALDELREYCMSPDCNQWKTALKLKDVKRFASFIEGNSHLSDDEILEYETSITAADFSDDEDLVTDDEDDE